MEDEGSKASAEREDQVISEQELTKFEYYAEMGEEYGFSPKKSQELSLYL